MDAVIGSEPGFSFPNRIKFTIYNTSPPPGL